MCPSTWSESDGGGMGIRQTGREKLSRVTRNEFREWLVGWTLREISDLFDAHGIERIPLRETDLPSGQRRSLVECYYASVDWTDIGDVGQMLRVYEDILFQMPEANSEQRTLLLRYLERDGFTLDGNQLISNRDSILDPDAFVALDVEHLAMHVRRIEKALPDDPAAAIGAAKELLESTLKTILEGQGKMFGPSDDVPQLLKLVQTELELAPREIDSAKRGAETIRRTLSNLGAIVLGVAELRNLYGTGHGKGRAHRGLGVRHARLAVSSAAALCMFLLETHAERAVR